MAPAAVSSLPAELPTIDGIPTERAGNGEGIGKHDPKATEFGSELFAQPTFESKEQERHNLKERLAAGIRIFGKFNFDHHIVRRFLFSSSKIGCLDNDSNC